MTVRKRADDDEVIAILDLHAAGQSPEQIAKILDVSVRSVRQRIARVVTEDCLADPEAETYWKGLNQ